MVHNFYAILGVGRNATTDEIKKAYKKAALLYHPDKNPGNRSATRFFQLLKEGKEILCNPEDREEYDDDLECSELDEAEKRAAAEEEFWKRALETCRKKREAAAKAGPPEKKARIDEEDSTQGEVKRLRNYWEI